MLRMVVSWWHRQAASRPRQLLTANSDIQPCAFNLLRGTPGLSQQRTGASRHLLVARQQRCGQARVRTFAHTGQNSSLSSAAWAPLKPHTDPANNKAAKHLQPSSASSPPPPSQPSPTNSRPAPSASPAPSATSSEQAAQYAATHPPQPPTTPPTRTAIQAAPLLQPLPQRAARPSSLSTNDIHKATPPQSISPNGSGPKPAAPGTWLPQPPNAPAAAPQLPPYAAPLAPPPPQTAQAAAAAAGPSPSSSPSEELYDAKEHPPTFTQFHPPQGAPTDTDRRNSNGQASTSAPSPPPPFRRPTWSSAAPVNIGARPFTLNSQQAPPADPLLEPIRPVQPTITRKLANEAELAEKLKEWHIELPSYVEGTYRLQCPNCGGSSDGQHDQDSCSVTVSLESASAMWNCFRASCGFKGGVVVGAPADRQSSRQRQLKATKPVKPSGDALQPLTQELRDWFWEQRGISGEVLEEWGVGLGQCMRTGEAAIAFPYYRPLPDGGKELVNIKFRTLNKRMWQVKGAEEILYGLHALPWAGLQAKAPNQTRQLVLVEGEMDALAVAEALRWARQQGGWWADWAGGIGVLSVPAGAPAQIKDELPPPEQDRKFAYVYACRQWLSLESAQLDRVVLATDSDEAGQCLAEELARRLGKVYCWGVAWPTSWQEHREAAWEQRPECQAFLQASPEQQHQAQQQKQLRQRPQLQQQPQQQPQEQEQGAAPAAEYTNGVGNTRAASNGVMWDGAPPDALRQAYDSQPQPGELQQEEGGADAEAAVQALDDGARKDANEVLLRDGPAALAENLLAAGLYYLEGLSQVVDFEPSIWEMYERNTLAEHMGVTTGWPGLDALYRVVPGELTLITGVPNSGKSNWLDALCVNLARSHGWRFAMCSFEKEPKDHVAQLAEKVTGKPFFSLGQAAIGNAERMTAEELEGAIEFINQHFAIIWSEHGEMPDIEWVIAKAEEAVLRHGINGLVIDPYNEIDHLRPQNKTETEYVSSMLSQVKRFAKHHQVHVWFVAHPRAMREWRGEAPQMYDIAGSAHFLNKSDNGIVVHRNLINPNKKAVDKHGNPLPDDQQPDPRLVQVLVRKVRNRWAGRVGEYALYYDRVSGRYTDDEWYHQVEEIRQSSSTLGPVAPSSSSPGSYHVGPPPGSYHVGPPPGSNGSGSSQHSYSTAAAPTERPVPPVLNGWHSLGAGVGPAGADGYMDADGGQEEDDADMEFDPRSEAEQQAGVSQAAPAPKPAAAPFVEGFKAATTGNTEAVIRRKPAPFVQNEAGDEWGS